jgi:subtilisin family serine protease
VNRFKYILLFLFVFTSHVEAGQWILTFKNDASRRFLDRELKKLKLNVSPVFSSNERSVLKKLKLNALSYSYLMEASQQETNRIQTLIDSHKLKASLEENYEVILSADPLESLQWGISNVGKPQPLYFADYTKDFLPAVMGEDSRPLSAEMEAKFPAQPVTVAVLDTGLDIGTDMRLDKMHVEFRESIAFNKAECDEWAKYQECLKEPGKTKNSCQIKFSTHDMDGNGYPMDCMGWNVVPDRDFSTKLKGSPDVRESDEGHGTHVSGIIAAASGNGYGGRGIALNAKILPVKVIVDAPNHPIAPKTSTNGGSPSQLPKPSEFDARAKKAFVNQIARGMLYALRAGAKVINLSMGWPAGVHTPLMNEMIQAAKEREVIIVASAGNDSTLANVMPCNREDVICVGAHGPSGEIAHYSSFGSVVDIAAPGTNILSTWPRHKVGERFSIVSGYGYQDGTSMATPFVAGALARLLGSGFSPHEAVARMLASARAIRENPNQSPYLSVKYVRTGNLDLTNAFTISPEPLIVPAKKEKNFINWDRRSTHVEFSIPLKNIWAAAGPVQIEGEMFHSPTSPAGQLANGAWSFDNWASGEVKNLVGSIEIEDPLHFAQDLTLKLSVRTAQKTRELKLEINVRVPMESLLADVQTIRLPIRNLQFDGDTYLKTFISSRPAANPDYLFVKVADPDWELQVAKFVGGQYEVLSRGRIKGIFTEFNSIDGRVGKIPAAVFGLYKIDFDFDGMEDYVIFFKEISLMDNQVTGFKILYFKDQSGQLELVNQIDYDNQNTHIPDSFQWMKAQDKGRSILVPAWIAQGKRPKSELPTYDPFNREPTGTLENRLYYVTSEGQKTVSLVQNKKEKVQPYLLRIMSASIEEQAQGKFPVLSAKGEGYKSQYFISMVSDGQFGEFKELVLPEFQQLYGLNNIQNILSLDGTEYQVGTSITGPSLQGTLKTTFLPFHRADLQAVATVQKPVVFTDSVMSIAATFMGSGQLAAYGQTHYELQYFDLSSGQTALTTLNKFSYMPAFLSYNLGYIPLTVQMQGRRLPSVLVSASWAKSGGDEIVVPHYNDDRLLGLIRPARYKILPGECSGSPAQIDGSKDWPSQLVFFCKGQENYFVRLPLSD